MFNDKTICIVVPAHNEETQIINVIHTMPDYVDRILIINDFSTDKTKEVVEQEARKNQKVLLLNHKINKGVGGAIETGYKWARDNDYDIAVVMAGDGQMDPEDLPNILAPVANDEVDYTKGNRLFTGEAYKKIPKVRYFGNSALSFLTKIASGYWHIADSQSGYTAINKKALQLIDWNKMYRRYGQPNDLLVRLNIYNLKVRDVPIKPVYNIGEKSGIKIRTVIFRLSWLLLKMYLYRMKEKYIIRDFHPLVLFYFTGFLFSLFTVLLFVRLVIMWGITGHIPPINALAFMFTFMSANLFILFAMWFDMETNKGLK